MSKKSKRYVECSKLVDSEKLYSFKDALSVLKSFPESKFDETVEMHFNLGIDPRHSDQQLRGTFSLPHGTGSSVRVAVITQDDLHQAAKDAGADEVGSDDLVEKISGGWLDFDILIASPNMMAKVGRLGKILGGKGLMPSPKSGTVTPDVVKAIAEFKKGKIEYRNDKYGNIHLKVGKRSFDDNALHENVSEAMDVILKAKPSKAKGVYVKSLALCFTQGPVIMIDPLNQKGEA